DQIKLDIAPTTQQLPIFFARTVLLMTVSIHDFTVYRCKGATEITRKVKNLRKRQAGFCGCEVIVKNTASTPCFFAMFDKKVIVCPCLEIAIKIRMVAIANIFQGLLKIPCILRHYIMWCKVNAATNPSHLLNQLKIAHIRVYNGHRRITRV